MKKNVLFTNSNYKIWNKTVILNEMNPHAKKILFYQSKSLKYIVSNYAIIIKFLEFM